MYGAGLLACLFQLRVGIVRVVFLFFDVPMSIGVFIAITMITMPTVFCQRFAHGQKWMHQLFSITHTRTRPDGRAFLVLFRHLWGQERRVSRQGGRMQDGLGGVNLGGPVCAKSLPPFPLPSEKILFFSFSSLPAEH